MKEKDENTTPAPTQVPEEATKDARELADKEVEGIAGGTVPIIKPF